jgi:hypothetical protein
VADVGRVAEPNWVVVVGGDTRKVSAMDSVSVVVLLQAAISSRTANAAVARTAAWLSTRALTATGVGVA